MKVNKVKAQEPKIHLANDIAIVSVIVDMEGKFLGASFKMKYRILRVWKKLNAKWKVLAGNSSIL